MFLGSLLPAAAGAKGPEIQPKSAEAQVHWNDETGKPLDPPVSWKGRWVWTRSPVPQLNRPVYQVQLIFPARSLVKILRRSKMRGDVFQVPQSKVRPLLVADTISPSSFLLLEITEDHGETKRVRFSLDLKAEKTAIWTHRRCTDEKIFLRESSLENQDSFLYVAATCRRKGRELSVTLLWSDDGDPGKISLTDLSGHKIKVSKPPKKEKSPEEDHRNLAWMNFSLPLETSHSHPSLPSLRAPANLGELSMAGSQDSDSENYFSLEWMPRRERPRWNWQAQFGFATYDYSEKAESLQVGQTALTGGLSVQHSLHNSRFNFEGDLNASLLPVNSSLSSVDSSISSAAPRFYQGDAGFGYLVPRAALLESVPNLKFSLGGQFWGMIVPGNQYGVKLIMGPQLKMQFFGERGPHRRQWQVQTSVAPFSEKIIAMQMNSYKFDIDGSYELTGSMAKYPISVIGGLERISMDFMDSNNGFQSFTLGLGLKIGF